MLILEDNPGVVDLLVKRYPGGKQSTHLHSLAVGEKLFVVAAIPGFSWKPNLTSHVILIAGGSGITPVFQLMQGILRNPEDKTSTTLILGSKDNDGLLLKSELDQVAKDYPARVKAFYTVSHLIEGSTTRQGHIDKEFLETILPHRDQENHVFVCGPPSMEMFSVGKRNTPGILEQLGFKKNYIHTF
jgi:cytochrome-b5 reductase